MDSNSSSNNKILASLLTMVLLLPLLTACFKNEAVNTNERRTLRIAYMYGDSGYDDYMRTQYTDLFAFNRKHIDIELVPAVDYGKQRYYVPREGEPYEEPNPMEEMKNLIEGDNPPDVIMVGLDELVLLIEDNLLQSLQPFIERDEFDTEAIVPSVINGLKEAGNGTLYALAPTFSSSALIYNKQLFRERGVEFPEDGMSWSRIFDLASRVAHGEGSDRVYGFSFSRSYWDDLFNAMDLYASPLQLQIMDAEAERMLVDNDQWERVWTDLVRLKEQRILPEPPEYNDGMMQPSPFSGDAFMSGNLAMAITNFNSLNQLISANNNADLVEGFTPIEWDVVSLPTHEEAPGMGGSIYMDPILAISANAQNPEDAWDFIQFTNSREWAELKSRSLNMLVSHHEFIKPQEGLDYNIAAFYTLTPVRSIMSHVNYQLDPQVRQHIWQIYNLGYQKLREVTEEQKDVRQALREWATEGDAILKQARENADATPAVPLPMPVD